MAPAVPKCVSADTPQQGGDVGRSAVPSRKRGAASAGNHECGLHYPCFRMGRLMHRASGLGRIPERRKVVKPDARDRGGWSHAPVTWPAASERGTRLDRWMCQSSIPHGFWVRAAACVAGTRWVGQFPRMPLAGERRFHRGAGSELQNPEIDPTRHTQCRVGTPVESCPPAPTSSVQRSQALRREHV